MKYPGTYILIWLAILLWAAYAFAANSDFVKFTVCTRAGQPHSTYWVRKSTIGLIQETVGDRHREQVDSLGDMPHKDCVLMFNTSGTHRVFVIGDFESVLKKLRSE